MNPLRIHQFAPATANGDGVTTGIEFTRKLLTQLGHTSEVFSGNIPAGLTGQQPKEAFQPSQCDLLLVHHSMGHDQEDWILSQPCPKALVYHNITPSEFFASGSPEQHYAELGRAQLQRWNSHFEGAIAMSPYNSEDLTAASYHNIVTLPLLVELSRFDGETSPATSLGHDPARPLLISVGRIAENKRQHLLIEALWHLKQMGTSTPLPQLLLVGGTTSERYATNLRYHIHQLGLEQDVLLTGKCDDNQLRGLYQQAQAYWCASAHEGFCMPLIEAGWFNLPVISFISSNIPATLGEAGLILEQPSPQALACATAQLLQDTALQQQLISAGQRNLKRYSEQTLKPQLQHYIDSLQLSQTA